MRWLAISIVTVDAVSVDAQENINGMTGATRHGRRGNASVQPKRHRSVAQVIRSPGQR
jgi:hypothetical protein